MFLKKKYIYWVQTHKQDVGFLKQQKLKIQCKKTKIQTTFKETVFFLDYLMIYKPLS